MATTNGGLGAPGQPELNGMIQQDKEKQSVAVHSFDPDATPEQKAAAAGKGRSQIESGKKDASGGKEVAVTTGQTPAIAPTITVTDADSEPQPSGVPPPESLPPSQVPGALPESAIAEIPEWFKIGWRAVGGIDRAPPSEGVEKDKAILEMFVNEQLYGAWYHNAAVIFFAVFITRFLTVFHFGWGWIFVLLAFCATYYQTSMIRVRQRARDDIQRELTKSRLVSESETADWMNHFLDRFWLIYEPVLSQTIVQSVDQILSTNTPPIVDSLRLSTFTLGTKAPRIDSVRTWPHTAEDIVTMDWTFKFMPNDTSDMTRSEAEKKVNPKIVLSVRVGKGVTANMPILLEDMSFSGQMRVRMKLMTTFPHIQVVDLSFLQKPKFDYVLKPIGGDTFGFDIGIVPGLSAFIRDMVHSILGPMMYDPNVFTLNLEQLLSGAPIDTAIGVLQVTVHSARGLKGTKIGGGTPDPYVSLSINARRELARTKYKESTYNPSWNETKFLLINNLTEQLVLTVYDWNEHRKDTSLGAASFELSKLGEDAIQEGIEAKVLKDGKERGELRFDLSFYPVLKPEKVNGNEEELPDTKVGIVRLTLHQAKDLDHSKAMSNDLNPFAKVLLSSHSPPTHVTPKVKHTLNPVWESSTEFLCSDKRSSVITVKVVDDRDVFKDPVVGYLSIKLEDLLEAKKTARDWWPLSGCRSGRLRMSAEWKPLNMAGSLHGADQYVPPIGIVRLWVQKATDVKNIEAALGGKSDPYLRVLVNNVTMGRTEVVNNNLNPEWDQIIYIPVHSLKETMLLECMDYQHLTKDRSLGSVELKVRDLAIKSKDAKYHYASTGKKTCVEPIRLDHGNVYKGQLHYVAEFVPAVAIKGVSFESSGTEIDKIVNGRGSETSSMSSSDIEAEAIPEGITTSRPMGDTGDEDSTDSECDSPTAAKANHTKNTKSMDSTKTGETNKTNNESIKTNGTNETGETAESEEGIEMSREELLSHQSGIIVFNVRRGQLSEKARLEVLLDDGYWPAFSTARPRSTHAQWDHVGEGFIKELDFGRVWLRLNENDEGEKDDIVAEFKGEAKTFLEQTLSGPATFTLTSDDEKDTSTVEIETRYVPVDITLEPRESINNMGILRVDLIDGHGIRGVDRGGKSDPYVVFTLNDQKVYKSQTKKKTLNPEWNESFAVQVPSRVGADFWLEVFDWNQIEQAKSLGTGKIELADLEPFEAVERSIKFEHTKHGDSGDIRIRLMFTPEIIARTRKATSTFSTAGRAMTQMGGIPLGAGKGVVQGVGKVGNKIGAVVFGKDRNEKEEPVPVVTAEPPSGAPDGSNGTNTVDFATPTKPAAGGEEQVPAEPGTLRVSVLNAKDLRDADGDTPKPYVLVRVGEKEHKTKHSGKSTATPEWNETLSFPAGPSTPKMQVTVYDHKTLGKDRLVGEAEVDIWRHVHPNGSGVDVLLELREGSGQVALRLQFDTLPDPTTRSMTSSSNRTPFGSPSRFSFSRRPAADE